MRIIGEIVLLHKDLVWRYNAGYFYHPIPFVIKFDGCTCLLTNGVSFNALTYPKLYEFLGSDNTPEIKSFDGVVAYIVAEVGKPEPEKKRRLW